MGLRKIVENAEERIADSYARHFCEEKPQIIRIVMRAIDHAVDEGKRIRSQDKLVYNVLHAIYDGRENEREQIRSWYSRYQKIRDYKLEKLKR